MSFYENFITICESKGLKPNPVAMKCGGTKSSANSWKNGSVPNIKIIVKIAEYLNVSVDALLGRTPSQSAFEIVPTDKFYMIPVYESISAGLGTTACSDIVGYESVKIDNPYDVDDTMCIKVTGDSMYPKIEDGDIIVVRKQSCVNSGQIAAILIDNEEGLVKKVEYGNNQIKLISINPMYPPQIYVNEETERVSIVGVVRKIIKTVD